MTGPGQVERTVVPRRVRRRWALVGAVALFVAAVSSAQAWTAPVTSDQLYESSGPISALPSRLAADSFTGATGPLAGKISDTGQPWLGLSGTLQQTGGHLVCTDCSGNRYGIAVLDVGAASVTATVDITPQNNGGSMGLVLNADASGSRSIIAWWTGNDLQLVRRVGTTNTTLQTLRVSGVPDNVAATLGVTVLDGTYRVSFAGAERFTVTLSAADRAAYAANTYFGVVFVNNTNFLDSFLITP